jgi:hypothetical protein
MIEKPDFSVVPGHRDLEQPELPSKFSAIPGWRQIAPAPTPDEIVSESEPTTEE